MKMSGITSHLNKVLVFGILCLTLLSCHKKCLPEGSYLISFAGSYKEGGVVYSSNSLMQVSISNTTANGFLMNGTIDIKKDGKHVTGDFSGGSYNTISIDGECDKKNGNDFVEGEFTATDVDGHIITGKFSIDKN